MVDDIGATCSDNIASNDRDAIRVTRASCR